MPARLLTRLTTLALLILNCAISSGCYHGWHHHWHR